MSPKRWQAAMEADDLLIMQLLDLPGRQQRNTLFRSPFARLLSVTGGVRLGICRSLAKTALEILRGGLVGWTVVELSFHVVPEDLGSCPPIDRFKLRQGLDSHPQTDPPANDSRRIIS